MTTLAWRRRVEPDERPEPPAEVTPMWPVLAALEVTTVDHRLLGWIAPEGERTSDWMNRGLEIELVGPVEEASDAPSGSLVEADEGSTRVQLPVADVLFAVPPALPVGRHLRLHRRIHAIHFEVGPYEVYGRIHVRPGAQVGDYLLRSSRVFVPITEVDLVHHAEPAFRRRLPVLIVNSRHVTRLYSGETRDPVSTSVLAAAPPSAPDAAAPMAVPVIDAASPADRPAEPEPFRGEIHRSLAELAALRADDLITVGEYRAKRAEILARL